MMKTTFYTHGKNGSPAQPSTLVECAQTLYLKWSTASYIPIDRSNNYPIIILQKQTLEIRGCGYGCGGGGCHRHHRYSPADTIVQLFSVSTVHELSIVFDGAQHKIESPCVCVPLVYLVFQEEEESVRQRGREKAKENEKSANELVKQYRTIIMMTKKNCFTLLLLSSSSPSS